MSAARIAFLEAEVDARNVTIQLLDEEKHQALAELMASTTVFAEATKARAREEVFSIQARLRNDLVEHLCPVEELLRHLTANLGVALEQLGELTEGVRAERAQWEADRCEMEATLREARRAHSLADGAEETPKAARQRRTQRTTLVCGGFPPTPRAVV